MSFPTARRMVAPLGGMGVWACNLYPHCGCRLHAHKSVTDLSSRFVCRQVTSSPLKFETTTIASGADWGIQHVLGWVMTCSEGSVVYYLPPVLALRITQIISSPCTGLKNILTTFCNYNKLSVWNSWCVLEIYSLEIRREEYINIWYHDLPHLGVLKSS